VRHPPPGGIDPDGVVHIARRLLDETDGSMLQTGLVCAPTGGNESLSKEHGKPRLPYGYHMAMARTQTLVQLSDDLLERIDRLRDREGRSRSELIREAIEQYLTEHQEADVDRLIVEAYTLRPPDDDWADDAARRMIAAEPW
jgi:predicted DNA-binding protein